MPTSAADRSSSTPPNDAFTRFSRLVEWPMAVLALAVVPALVLEQRASSDGLTMAALVGNWVIWIGFCGEYLVKLYLAPQRVAFVRAAWFDLVIIVLSPPFLVPDSLQATRSLRAVRVLRLLRLIRVVAVAAMGLRLLRGLLDRHRFHYVLTLAVAVVGLGALAIYVVEPASNPAIQSLEDALWWAVVTATTVGYGDVSPVTLEGRLVAVVLMITGIGVIGVFTATVASMFFEQESEPETSRIEARLAAVEAKLDQLLAQSDAAREPPAGRRRAAADH